MEDKLEWLLDPNWKPKSVKYITNKKGKNENK